MRQSSIISPFRHIMKSYRQLGYLILLTRVFVHVNMAQLILLNDCCIRRDVRIKFDYIKFN